MQIYNNIILLSLVPNVHGAEVELISSVIISKLLD